MTTTRPPIDPLEAPRSLPATTTTIVEGQAIHPLDRLRHFHADEWEDFVVEWASTLADYVDVGRRGGSGDQGRDVIGYLSDGGYDCYQCKHYDHAIQPNEIWIEIGKLIYNTKIGTYRCPRRYVLLAPQGAGTKLSNLLDDPDSLRAELLSNWDTHCAGKLVPRSTLALDADLRAYIEDFDFRIFGTISPHKLIDAHAETRWHAVRFGGGLRERPEPDLPPAALEPRELRYVRALLEAYGDHLGATVEAVGDITAASPLARHFDDARTDFYSAESLRVFSRDSLPPREFKKLQRQIHGGIADCLSDSHEDGYRRVRAVCQVARSLHVTGHPLHTRMVPRDAAGICHQLANDGTIGSWLG